MTKGALFLIIIITLLGCYSSGKNSVLREGVYFPHASGQLSKFILKEDSLFSYQMYGMQGERVLEISIVEFVELNDSLEILKGKKVKMSESSLRKSNREQFNYFVFKIIDKNQVKLIYSESFPTEKEIDSSLNSIDTSRRNGLTLYRHNYFESFSEMKSISSKSDYDIIYSYINSDKSQKLVDDFKKQGMISVYGVAVTSELLNQACLKNGYNPLEVPEQLREFGNE